ncbi:helix-turn-helix transcriptional regulator [Peterkaempfera bronchialis]|uniref:LuxR family transcriptional regulator n=1 Tax=Peterkaempfera bronchialis TaxID=2126346 RepID=A0A345SYP4_9ACTN|nr:helix-turn-helix transcriptional regulator [Peterkaempfera bronchialis]AXI78849.1 LuxR family transcriptional regulator [Peterkaempfera bronchialis]
MLNNPDWTPDQARRELDLSQIGYELALHTLLEAGLLRATSDSRGFTPVAPETAVAWLLAVEEESAARWISAVQERRSTISALAANMMQLQAKSSTETRIQLLTGEERISAALHGASVTVQSEILSMHPGAPLPKEALEASMARNRSVLERGVTMRSIHLEAMDRVPYAKAHLEALQESGCQVRVTPTLPFRLILVDQVLAYVTAPVKGAGLSALEIRGDEVCWLLRQAFEHCWLHGRPVVRSGSAEEGVDLSDREKAVLRMLAAGYTDDSVARALGISTRTLRRMTTMILEKIGARSRFEAGVRSAMLSLI